MFLWQPTATVFPFSLTTNANPKRRVQHDLSVNWKLAAIGRLLLKAWKSSYCSFSPCFEKLLRLCSQQARHQPKSTELFHFLQSANFNTLSALRLNSGAKSLYSFDSWRHQPKGLVKEVCNIFTPELITTMVEPSRRPQVPYILPSINSYNFLWDGKL